MNKNSENRHSCHIPVSIQAFTIKCNFINKNCFRFCFLLDCFVSFFGCPLSIEDVSSISTLLRVFNIMGLEICQMLFLHPLKYPYDFFPFIFLM